MNPILVFIGILVVVLVGHAVGAGALIDAIERRFRALATGATTRAEDIYLEHIAPRLKRLSWVAVALFGLGVVASIVLAAAVKAVPVWNVFVVLVIGVGFSVWIIWNWRKTLSEFSSGTLLTATLTGFSTLGLVEFLIGNALHTRALTYFGTCYILVAFGIFSVVLVACIKLLAAGIFNLEAITNLIIKLAVGLVMSGKQALNTLVGPGGVQYAHEEGWVPWALRVLGSLSMFFFPYLIIGNLLPSMAIQTALWIIGVVMFMLWSQLQGVGISTLSRRQRSVLLLEKLVLILIPLMLIAFLSSKGEAELDRFRDVLEDLMVGVITGATDALVKARTKLAWLIVACILLYAVWPPRKNPNDPPGEDSRILPGIRKYAGLFIGVFCLWLVGDLFWLFAKPTVHETVADIKGAYLEKFVPTLTNETANGRQVVKVSWPQQSDADSYAIMRRSDDEKDQAMFHPLLDPLHPGTDRPVIVTQGATSYLDYTVRPGKKYEYQVISLRYSKIPCWAIPRPTPCEGLDELKMYMSEGEHSILTSNVSVKVAPAPTASATTVIVPGATKPPTQTCTGDSCSLRSDIDKVCMLDPSACAPN